MKEPIKYTKEEISLNLDKVNNIIDSLKAKRTDITKDINQAKKQLKYWEDLDKSQLKLFNI